MHIARLMSMMTNTFGCQVMDDACFNMSSLVTFIYIALYAIQMDSDKLYSDKTGK